MLSAQCVHSNERRLSRKGYFPLHVYRFVNNLVWHVSVIALFDLHRDLNSDVPRFKFSAFKNNKNKIFIVW